MEDNLKSIYDYLSSKGGQGSYEEFVDFFNANDDNKHTIYDYMAKEGGQGSYEEFLAFAGTPQRVDVSDVEKANQPNVVTLNEEELVGGKFTPRSNASTIKTPEELEADAQYQAWLGSVPENRRNDPNYDLRSAREHLSQKELEDWRTATDKELADGKKHLRSVYYDDKSGEYHFLKSKDHKSLQKELDWYNSDEPDAVEFKDQGWTLDKSGDYYKYVRDFSPEKVAEMKERNANATKDARSFIESVMPEIERSIRDRAMFDVEADNRNKGAGKETLEYHGGKEAEKRIKAFHDLLDEHGIGKRGITEEIINGDLSLNDEKLKGMVVDAIKKIDNTNSYLNAYYKTPEGRADIISQTQPQIDAVGAMKEKAGGFWNNLGGFLGDLAITGAMSEGGISVQDAKVLSDIQDNIRKETSVNMKTRQMLEDAENTLKIAQKNALEGADNFAVNLARGVRYANLETLIPMTDLYGNMGLLQVFDKIERGEELNDSEKLLVAAMYTNQNVQQNFSDQLTMGNRIGRGLPETAMFTLTFLGASEFAGAQTIGKGTEKATRMLANSLINKEIKNGAARFALNKALPKALGLAGETLYRTGLQTPAIMSGAIERHVGDVNINPETGEVGFVDGVNWREAVLKSAATVANENLTEAAGEAILQPGWGWLTRNTKAGKAVNKFRETVGGIGDNKIDDIFRTAQDIKRKAGFDGWTFETLEEMLGNFNDAAFIHDQSWEQAFSGATILETTLNCMIFGMVMGHASTGASAIYNAPNLVRTRNEKRKAKSVVNGMENISSNEIDEHIQYDTAKNLADWLFAKNQEGKWDETQRSAVVNYVKASIAQSAQRNFKGIRLEEDMKASDKIADEMINNSDGNIIEATFDVNGQKITGTIVGGSVSYTEHNDGSIGYNQYLSDPTLTIRLDNGEHKVLFARQLESINSVSTPDAFKAVRRNELAVQYANDMHREMDDLGVNDVWGVDLTQPGTTIFIGGVPNTLKEITEDGKYVFTSPTDDGKSVKETTYDASDLMMVGLIERHNELIRNGASQEQLDESIDNLNTQQTVNAAEASRDEDNVWNAISNFMKDYFKTDESGEFIPDESRADAAAAYLVAMRKGDVNAAINLVDERIAKLQMTINGESVDNAKNNAGTVEMAEEAAANDVAAENAQKNIEFLTIIRDGLVAKQNENNTDMSLNVAVSQMPEGTMFPVMWNGQRAIAVVDQHNENGDAVVNILDENGNEIERGIDDVSDEMWNQYRSKALESEAQVEPAEETNVEAANETPQEEQVIEINEVPAEKTVEQRLGEFSAKHGANTQNKLENTVKSIKKDIESLTKQIADAEEKLNNMPEPYDIKTQKAQEQQEKKIAKLQKEFQEKQDALAPFVELLEEYDRQATEKQGVLNKANEALQSLDENMKLYSEAPQQEVSDKEPTNKHEFASTFLGSFQKKKNRLNKESLKTETGWGEADVKKLNGILSAEGGMSVDEMAEAIFADAQEQYPGFFTDFNDAKTTLLEVLQEADNAGSIDTYIKDRRVANSEDQARLDYEAQQLGYEDAADMRKKRMADAQQKLKSLQDADGFISEEGLKEFEDYVEGLKIQETPAQNTETDNLSEQTENAENIGTDNGVQEVADNALKQAWREISDESRPSEGQQALAEPLYALLTGNLSEAERAKYMSDLIEAAKNNPDVPQSKLILDNVQTKKSDKFADSGFVNPDNVEVPFSVEADNSYQSRFDEIDAKIANARRSGQLTRAKLLQNQKAELIQEYLDTIKTDDVSILTSDNYEEKLKADGWTDDQIGQVRDKLAQVRAVGQAMGGFYLKGKIYIFADDIYSIDHARRTYIHERQHDITRKDVSLRDEISRSVPREELEQYVRDLSGSRTYDGSSSTALADEFISMAMAEAYSTDDVESVLEAKGVNNKELIEKIKTLDNEQRESDSLAKARRGAGANLHVDNNGQRSGRLDGRHQEGRSGEVGEQGLRPSFGSTQKTGIGGEVSSADEAEESAIKYSIVSDPKLKEELEKGEKIKVYRAMQMVDGKLYPPMAAKVNGKWQNPIELGVWEQADEHPELLDKNGKFKLDKGNGSSPMPVAYNPYIHTSYSPLNDQFTSASKRPNLVTVEVEIPKSELTSNYKAKGAKNAVGETEWPSGPVARELKEFGKPRVVVLSRYDKPIRIVPDSEVAQHIAKTLKDTGISIPYNVVTPSLRAELEKAGVKVTGKAKGNIKDEVSSKVSAKQDADYMQAVESGDMETAQGMVLEAAKAAMPNTKVIDKKGYPKVVYHGTIAEKPFYTFNTKDIYLLSKPQLANQYTHKRRALSVDPKQSGVIMPVFVNLENPYIVDANRRLWRNIQVDWSNTPVSTEDIAKYAREHGYDGVIIHKVRDNMFDDDPSYSDEYIAFNKNQVKSTGATYKDTKRSHYPWDEYKELASILGPTYDDQGNVIPLSKRFNESSDDIRFSVGTHIVNNGKSLVGMHNINADKLRKALKLGGLANPSTAVIDIDKQNHHGYGDISLIMPSSLVDARTGRNEGTYAGDAYTPTYPSVEYREGKESPKRIKELTKGLPDNLAWEIRSKVGQYMDGDTRRSGLEYVFLKEKGQEMPIAVDKRQYPNISLKEVGERLGLKDYKSQGFSSDLYDAYEKLEGDNLMKFNLWYEKKGDEKEIQRISAKSEDDEKYRKIFNNFYGEHMPFNQFDNIWSQILRDERDAGKENLGRTLEDAAIKVDELGLRTEFEDWLQKKIDDLGYEEVIFKGYDRNGYRKYIPNTLENASRMMNSQDRVNTYGDSFTNATKALFLDKFKSLKQIRDNKGKLEADKDKINEAYQKVSDDWTKLGIDFRDYTLHDDKTAFGLDDNPFIAVDNAMARMQEAMMTSDPIAYLNREYRYSLPKDSEFGKRINDIKERIQDLPSKYFETKFRRPVYFNEFASAVVPKDLPQDLKDALSQNGLKMYEYDPNVEGDRREKTLEATDDDEIRFSIANRNQNIFISNAEKAVEAIKQDKATPEQWLKMIEKSGGLKVGEDKWLGLSEWLKAQSAIDAPRGNESIAEWAERNKKKTLTKQEVLDFINENKIKIEEVKYSEENPINEVLNGFVREFQVLKREVYEENDELSGDEIGDAAFDKMVDKYGDDFSMAFEIGNNKRLQPIREPNGELSDAAKYFLGEEDAKSINPTRLDYTTKGLNNKREIALTVPTIESWNQGDNIHFGDAGEGRAIAWVRFGDTYIFDATGVSDALLTIKTLNKKYDNKLYRNPDMTEDDIVLRDNATAILDSNKSSERTRVLVIDEIQSKRHQEGREKGYAPSDDEFNKAVEERDAAWDAMKAFDEKISSEGKTYKTATDEEKKEMVRLQAEWSKATDEVERITRDQYNLIPVAPFEKNWQELAMKRMLRLAAEEGYDKLAWTTGEQQAARYDLSKEVRAIHWDKQTAKEDGKIYVSVETDYGYPIKGDMTPQEIEAQLGKEIAKKIVDGGRYGVLKDEGLKVGGEGMKGFYDKMLVSFMNKYGKQWGVKVEDVTMPNLEEGYQTMHSIDVNDQMKQDVMEGQVMFSVSGKKKKSSSESDDKQLSLFLQNNSGEYETQDGEKVGFTSILGLTEDVLSAGEQASAGRRDDVQREESPLTYKLRRLEPGETCHVERRFQESKQFDFTGSDNIETADDVAYIFKQLEDAAVENSFIVLVKDGKPTIIHTGMGGYTSASAEYGGGIVAYKHINPDKVWFIHNHPSGEIQSSEQDRKIAKNIRTIFGNKFKGGIIIDTVSGQYGLFDEYSDAEIGSTKNIPDNETELKVYEFSKQVFDKDWNPQTAFPAQSSKDIAAFISSHRLGEHDKMSLLVLNNKNKVVGNVFLPYTEISDDTADKIADEALYYANQIGGTAVIIYGNFALNYIKPRNIDGIKKKINAQSRLLDIISSDRDVTYYESASEQNMLNDKTEPYNDIRFSVSKPENRIADEYNRTTGANVDGVSQNIQRKENILRSFFDGLRPLEQLQKLMSKTMGRKLRDSEDAYKLATLLPSLNKAEMDAADMEYYNPTARQFADLVKLVMTKEGLAYADALEKVNNYLLAKHGLERNEWFMEKDPESEEKDRAGLRGLAKSVGENEDDYKAVAEKIVKDFEGNYDANKFWTAMRALSNRILEIGYEKGMINKATLEELKKRFEFYVPLRGFAETTADDMFDYVRTSPYFQNVFQKAKGRTSKADDPMSNVRSMLQSNIVLGNHNRVMQRIYNMAVNSKSDLLRIVRPWFVYDEASDSWVERYPEITEDMTADEVDATVKDFNERMQKLAKEGKAQRKTNTLDVGAKILKYQAKEHEMVTYIDGERVVVIIAGNPLVAQQLNSVAPKQLGAWAEKAIGVTRLFSMINTSLSPAFMFTNAARDIGFSLFSAFVTGGGKKNIKMLWNIMKAAWVLPRLIAIGKMDGGIVKMLNKEEAAKLEQWWHEFISNGGETGFVQTLNAEKMKGKVDNMIKRMVNHPKNKDGEAAWRKATLDVIETMGRYSEDISRFAAYCLKRAEGESVQKSITEAKNVTVNFNVKGGGNSWLAGAVASLRAIYSFFNAALQGINRMARLAKENPKRFAAGLTTCVLQGFMLPWLNMAMLGLLGGDDDDWRRYEMLTEYTANHSLVLYVGNHKFIRIPYSQELAPFAAMGNIFFRQQQGWNHGSSVGAQIADMFVDLAPVNIGESKTFLGKVAKTASPTFIKPITELLLNEDFTGSPIYKDDEQHRFDRGWEKAYEGKTSKWLIDASKYLEDKTNIDINPAMVEHIAQGLFGGLGRSGDRLLRFVSNGFQLSDTPFIRTLMFSSNPISYKGAVSKEYGRLAYNVLDKTQAKIKRMSNAEFIKFMDTEEYKIADAVCKAKTGKSLLGTKVSDSSIDKDEKQYKKAKATEGLTDEQKEMLEQWSAEITEEKMELIDEITQIKFENAGNFRKSEMNAVNEIKEKSKTKYQEKHGKE